MTEKFQKFAKLYVHGLAVVALSFVVTLFLAYAVPLLSETAVGSLLFLACFLAVYPLALGYLNFVLADLLWQTDYDVRAWKFWVCGAVLLAVYFVIGIVLSFLFSALVVVFALTVQDEQAYYLWSEIFALIVNVAITPPLYGFVGGKIADMMEKRK
jgi:hypothetical protein